MKMKWEKTDKKSDMARATGLGSAGDGTHHWMAQRVSAIALVPLVFWALWSVVNLVGADHAAFTEWLSAPINAILMILFIVTTFYHAVLGNQVVIEDYVHCECLKIAKLIGQKLFFAALGVACVFSILQIAL